MKQAERVDRSTTALLDAAVEIVIDEGYAGLSLAAVGQRSGYSRSLVTVRFGSKEGLVDALFKRTTMRWEELADADAEALRTLDRICIDYGQMANQWDRDPTNMRCLWRLLFSSVGADEYLQERCRALQTRSRRRLRSRIEAGQADGSIRPELDAAHEADQQLATLRGIGFEVNLDPAYDVASAIRHLATSAEERLSTPVDGRRKRT